MELIKGEDQMFSLGRWAIWCGTGVIGLFFLLVTTCTMQSNAYEPDVIKAQAEEVRASAVLQKERLAIVKERLAAVERLVDKGIHPVIARCSVTSSFQNDQCHNIVPRLTEIEVMSGGVK
jgi:hypothetical protein